MGEYQWKKTAWGRRYDIFRDGRKVGHLAYTNLMATRAEGELNGKTYGFRGRDGFFGRRVTIQPGDGPERELKVNAMGSGARLDDGRSWSINAWQTRWNWTSPAGTPLVSSIKESASGSKGSIMIHDETHPDDRGLLVLSGLYVRNHVAELTAAVTTVVIVVVVSM